MVKLTDSIVFSLALTRPAAAQQSSGGFNSDLGSMAFGGFPPNINLTNTSVTAPIQGFVVGTGPSNATDAVDLYWTVDVQSFSCEGCNITGSTFSNETILDSGTVLYICYPNCSHQQSTTGTALNLLPANVVEAFAAACSPPATLVTTGAFAGLYQVDCNATVPPFEVQIGGTTFTVDPKDNLLSSGTTDENGKEICGLATTTDMLKGATSDFLIL
jgi:hypothetical protein